MPGKKRYGKDVFNRFGKRGVSCPDGEGGKGIVRQVCHLEKAIPSGEGGDHGGKGKSPQKPAQKSSSSSMASGSTRLFRSNFFQEGDCSTRQEEGE